MGLVDQGTPSQPKPHIPTPLIFSSFFFFLFSLSFPLHYFLFISIFLQVQTWGLWAVPQGGAFPERRYTSGL